MYNMLIIESQILIRAKEGILSCRNGRLINIPASKQRANCTVLRNTESSNYHSCIKEWAPNDGVGPSK